MAIKYGLSYRGNKSRLAKRLFSLFPEAKHFYDLFGGGGAMTHYAIYNNSYPHVHLNDINPLIVKAFMYSYNGRYNDETRWISREDFHRLKHVDPYAAICFSFSSDLASYLYSQEKQEEARAAHEAVFKGNFELSDSLIGVDLRPTLSGTTWKEKVTIAKRIIRQADKDGTIKGRRGRDFRLQHFEKLQVFHSLSTLPRYNITHSATSYQNVVIEPDSVIYCDIPYIGTKDYHGPGAHFDHEAFYEWCAKQTEPVFISSYEMPEDKFVCIAEYDRRESVDAYNNSAIVKERVFRPIHQVKQ